VLLVSSDLWTKTWALRFFGQLSACFLMKPDIKNISHYRKYNRAVQGDLAEDGVAPDVMISSMDGKPQSLLRCRGGANPLVLVAGSYS